MFVMMTQRSTGEVMKLVPFLTLGLAVVGCSEPGDSQILSGNGTAPAATADNARDDRPVARLKRDRVIEEYAPTGDRSPDGLVGRWTGVEGMYLVVTNAKVPGHYMLEMRWDLDHKGVFAGAARGNTIEFQRDGILETLRAADGDSTGLKYLAGKKTCVMVKTGEGYCRG
jgi:hypothetical protein